MRSQATNNTVSVRSSSKQAALFCYLTRIIWKLALSIPWTSLDPESFRRVGEVAGMVERTAAKVRLAREARVREGGG